MPSFQAKQLTTVRLGSLCLAILMDPIGSIVKMHRGIWFVRSPISSRPWRWQKFWQPHARSTQSLSLVPLSAQVQSAFASLSTIKLSCFYWTSKSGQGWRQAAWSWFGVVFHCNAATSTILLALLHLKNSSCPEHLSAHRIMLEEKNSAKRKGSREKTWTVLLAWKHPFGGKHAEVWLRRLQAKQIPVYGEAATNF